MFGNYLGCRRFQKRWVSLCAFCESHRSAIGTVIAVGAVMEIPALHQPTKTTKTNISMKTYKNYRSRYSFL